MAPLSRADRVEAGLRDAVSSPDRARAADQLCAACVELLDVDGAALSLWLDGDARGTFGASGTLSRRLDELQFTFGEGPCVDAVRTDRPVLVNDLDQARQARWPAFTGAALEAGVGAIFAMPVRIAVMPFGSLDLFRHRAGELSDADLNAGFEAAELATLPLLDLMSSQVDWAAVGEGGDASEQLASLERVEVYQAVGMLIGQLDVTPAEAMARLRGHAFSTGATASEVAWRIVDRRLTLEGDVL
ncbi:MAG TPA: GAF and ANTAR domain-containing protein [Frankiaceae bacterium]|nr:GAF and ANTAR domain-containing protein [Frankiaceae bacterium]